MIDIKLQKKEAADFLNKKGRRIDLIFFGLVLVFTAIMPFYLFSYFSYLFEFVAEYIVKTAGLAEKYLETFEMIFVLASAAFAVLLYVFITFPTYSCFFCHSYKVYRNGIAGERKLLCFGKHGYGGALGAGSLIFGIFALCLAPVIAFVTFGIGYVTDNETTLATILSYLFVVGVAICLALGFLIFLLFKPLFLLGYYVARGKKLGEACSLSVRQMRSQRAKQIYWQYIGAFLPSLLLGLVTVLVLFLIDTLPKMTVVYFNVADDIIYGE